ncbi:hypothetical protein ONQ97_27240, partial [Salmonella enterica subsp. enterica serovar Virginia]|nr:hypothetical protein [Salmonella enterica subsp. enterica serovar Virginia]
QRQPHVSTSSPPIAGEHAGASSATIMTTDDTPARSCGLNCCQLETTSSLQAAAATVLNVTEDHMDRYPFGLQQYRAAKLRVYE